MVTLSIVERFSKKFSLLESWLNFLQDACNISTTPLKCCHFTLQNMKCDKNDKLTICYSLFYLKINDTVKLVKLFEKTFIWAHLFLIKLSRCCFHWSVLLLMKVLLRRKFEKLTSGNALTQTCINNSIDEWKQHLESVIKNNGAHIEHLFK